MDRCKELNKLIIENQILQLNLTEAEDALLRAKEISTPLTSKKEREYIKQANLNAELIMNQKAELERLKNIILNRYSLSEKDRATVRHLRSEL